MSHKGLRWQEVLHWPWHSKWRARRLNSTAVPTAAPIIAPTTAPDTHESFGVGDIAMITVIGIVGLMVFGGMGKGCSYGLREERQFDWRIREGNGVPPPPADVGAPSNDIIVEVPTQRDAATQLSPTPEAASGVSLPTYAAVLENTPDGVTTEEEIPAPPPYVPPSGSQGLSHPFNNPVFEASVIRGRGGFSLGS